MTSQFLRLIPLSHRLLLLKRLQRARLGTTSTLTSVEAQPRRLLEGRIT